MGGCSRPVIPGKTLEPRMSFGGRPHEVTPPCPASKKIDCNDHRETGEAMVAIWQFQEKAHD